MATQPGIKGTPAAPITVTYTNKLRGVGGGAQSKVFPPMNSIPFTKYGAPAPKSNKLQAVTGETSENLPEEFSWTKLDEAQNYISFNVDQSGINEPVNQGCCGSCWAWSTVVALADRYALANNKAPQKLSPSLVLSCCNGQSSSLDLTYSEMDVNDFTCLNLQLDSGSGGCDGGFPYAAALQCIQTGAPIWTDAQEDIVDIVISDTECPDMSTLQGQIAPCLDAYDTATDAKGVVVKASSLSEDAPHYISADATDGKVNAADYYANAMKNALLKGPIVGTFMVLGDFMEIGSELDSGFFTWDKTGGVYVPGAPYTDQKKEASQTAKITTNAEKLTVAEISTVVDGEEVSYGEINHGFHSVVVVGWGMQSVDNVPEGVESIDGKIPYWIIKNSWGKDWPTVDGKPYYDDDDLPPGYWKHAMRVKGAMNPSLGMDQPFLVKSEDSDELLAGATMVFYPEEFLDDYKSDKVNVQANTNGSVSKKSKWWLWLIWSILVAICLGGIIFCVYNKWPIQKK